MSHASLRRTLVAIFSYSASTDTDSGITRSIWTRVPSMSFGGLWWASRGTVFGKEGAPAHLPQEEQLSFWSFAASAPLDANGVIATGAIVGGTFAPFDIFRVHSVMPRNVFRNQVQVYCTNVDKADPAYVIGEGLIV